MFRRLAQCFVWSVAVLSAALMGPAAAAQTAAVTASDLNLSRAWVREASAMQSSTGAYLVVTNTSARATALVAVKTPAAARADVHETSMTARAPMPGMDGERGDVPAMGSADMMSMRKVERLVVPAHGTVALKPGGYHVMLFGLVNPLHVGDTITLTLTFEGGASKTVTAKVLGRAAVAYQP
jgi:copper(I)-binding protein